MAELQLECISLQAAADADTALLNKNITQIKRAHGKDDMSSYFVFPMNRWHLYSDFNNGYNTGGIIEYVRLFSIIAVIILLVACINFMNLSTARSEKRAKEVGIRKTLGSTRKQLILQFFFESIILTLIAFLLAVIAVVLLLPYFNLLVDRQIALQHHQIIFLDSGRWNHSIHRTCGWQLSGLIPVFFQTDKGFKRRV